MELSYPVSDISLYPCPENISEENYRVFNLQGAKMVKYYVDGNRHGFRTESKIITPAKYTKLHQAFHVDSRDKYAVGYLYTSKPDNNKIELVNLETGETPIECFSAYKFGKRYLAFRVNSSDGRISNHRWGVYDMLEDSVFLKAMLPPNSIGIIFEGLEAVYQQHVLQNN